MFTNNVKIFNFHGCKTFQFYKHVKTSVFTVAKLKILQIYFHNLGVPNLWKVRYT